MPNVISREGLTTLAGPPGVSSSAGMVLVNGSVESYQDFVEAMRETTISPLTIWATQPSVRKVIDFAARAVASTPQKVYRRVSDNDRERVTNHPLARVLREPSPGMIPFRFWHSVIVDWLMYDRWLALKVPSLDSARQLDIVRIQAERVGFTDDGLGRVSGIIVDGRPQKLSMAACLHDHGYSPLGANGTSPMRTLAQMLQESHEAGMYRRQVWKNGARIPAVIERPLDAPDWDDKAKARFSEGWRSYSRSGGQAGGTPILQDGMKLVKADAFTPVETDEIKTRQLTDAEVASSFHIAPELVGAREGNYSNVQAYRQMLYRDGLGPVYVAAEQIINAMLVPDLDPTGELYVEYDLDAKLRGSFEEQAKVMSTAIGAPWLTRNEGRGRQNLPRIEGGDELITPLNVIEGGQASPQDSGTQNED